MDIHGENSFKSKSYSSAAFALEKLPQEISSLSKEKIYAVRGIGQSVGDKVVELIETGELKSLQELIAQTPEGVLEMMNIKGLGPKKIHTIWKELEINSIEDLRQACMENRLAVVKGFGEKTQQKILESIHFQQQNVGSYRYALVEPFVEALQVKLLNKYPSALLQVTGDFRRQCEVVNRLEWVTTIEAEDLKKFFGNESTNLISESDNLLEFQADGAIHLLFHLSDKANFYEKLFGTTGSEEFMMTWKGQQLDKGSGYHDEEEIFEAASMPYIPPYLREKAGIIEKAKANSMPDVVQTSDVKGLIHSHSKWSDGSYSLEEMANALIELGFEYLVISDHSKSAYYANGLSEDKIIQQHKEIDALNNTLAPFRIFKSIECDILSDGAMDYSNEVLAGFDLVIASIHSNLDMTEEKAMMRLMGAITNSYVTIMGHLTGRLLTKRKGYPVDHKAIIDACAEHNKIIEINANPARLDMDWRWIEYALEKGLTLSIDPDAHTIEEFAMIKYGVLVAQKGGLTKAQNLSSFSRENFESFLLNRKTLVAQLS